MSETVTTSRPQAISWKRERDYRIVCDCQRHAARERRLWARSLRAVGQAGEFARKRSLALLIGVPIAFGVFELPIEAMNTTMANSMNTIRAKATVLDQNDFPIFTTRRVRSQFLNPAPAPNALTLDISKEEFFRTQIPYGSIIYREAQRNRLAPELVAAVVEAESDFRPTLVSNRDARGLMQIVPETGRLYGAGDLFNPEKNITAGTKYLRYLIDRFRDPRVALAAYNAGEGNVERFGGIPPFPETANYVQRVNARTRSYRARVQVRYLAALRVSAASVR